MTTFLSEHTAADLGLRTAVGTAIGRAKAALGEALARRKARFEGRRILGCDERCLQDIGVSRGDLRQALED